MSALQDVTAEAILIRKAMDAMGWEYQGGGPYPFTPRLRFKRGAETLVVDLNRDNLDAAIKEGYTRADIAPADVMADPRVVALVVAARELETQAKRAVNLGAITGSHWTHLGIARLRMSSVLATLPAPETGT